eukprot:CAMPEP_0194215920 /NCGR_PEP_ID=MMETSP0156-20130528/18048_1 /TAXON_ID=33649 /ORGANISM="Thalassionema nitzschioides, Strain L26-B" /LENGTH=1072 /DNA_ID=CAMNT_0038944565 /DNA_START=46 /DNA_END=3261 /DNA_ORIENTATION=+
MTAAEVDPSNPMFLSSFDKNGTLFHPDFMNCGGCVECNADDEEKVPALGEIELAQSNNGIEGNLSTRISIDNFDPAKLQVIQSVLLALSGVNGVFLGTEENIVNVQHDTSTGSSQILDTLKTLGFSAFLKESLNSESVQLVRSQLYVQGICCASECPSINKIVKPLNGVTKIQINITTKMVYVEHDPQVITADEIAMALHGQGFESRVHKDGSTQQDIQSASVGRTTLHVNKVLHKNDIVNIQELLRALQGVKRVGVNMTECVVYVEHNVTQVTAQQLQHHLQPSYDSSIALDGQEEITKRTVSDLTLARSKFVESTLFVKKLTLDHIAMLEKTFRKNYIPAQLRAFYPHVPSKTIKLEHNPSLLKVESVATLLNRFDMEASVAIDGAQENLALPLLEDYDIPIYGGMEMDNKSSLHLNVILSGLFWFISILSFVGGAWEYLKYAGLLSVLFGLPPVVLKAYRTIRRCQFDANCMMVTAAVGAIALQEYDEAASVAFLFAVSEYLESKASARARKALGSIANLRPDHANVIHPVTGEIAITPAERVPVGSLVSVRTGDKIAADGIIVDGSSSVDESSLTGEALPVAKKKDDEVSGGSINVGGSPFVIKTTCRVEDSAVSRLIRLVEEAQANRSPTEKLVDSFAKSYTPLVVSMAFLMCTIPWFFSPEAGHQWTLNGLIIIVIACPCALTISTPVTYAAALAATAQRGIIVKGGASLEALGSVKKVIFDKTGTLTKGEFVLNELHSVRKELSRREMLEYLYLLESPSSHPLSSTLVNAAREEGVGLPQHRHMTNHAILRGEGVEADVDGEKVYVGNKKLFSRLGMYDTLGSFKDQAESWSSGGGTVGFIGIEGKGIAGIFCVTDSVRAEANDVIKTLLEGGIEVIMLTGDSEGAANSVAKEVGLPTSSVHSQLLPEDKLHFVGSLIQPTAKKCTSCTPRSRVMMVGDGVNDAPALAVADVGVAMGEGAALAMEMSDITLMDCNLSKLVYAIQMGTRTVITIQENICLSLLAKLLVVGLTFVGKMTLLFAIAADVGIMLIVTLNGIKLLPRRQVYEREITKRIGMYKSYDPVSK